MTFRRDSMRARYVIAAAIAVVVLLAGGMDVRAATKTVVIKVEGMTCGGCATSIEKVLRGTDGVLEARVSFEKREAWVKYDDARVSEAKLREVIDGTGFKAVGAPQGAAAGRGCCSLQPAAPAGARDEKGRPASAYSSDLEALRAEFNRDRDKVRLLMLLSPT